MRKALKASLALAVVSASLSTATLGVSVLSSLVAAVDTLADTYLAMAPRSQVDLIEPRTEVELRIRVIHARSAGEKKFDLLLHDLKNHLLPYDYNSFTLLIDERMTLRLDEGQGIGLLSGQNLNVTLTSLTERKATVNLLLIGQTGKTLDTNVKCKSNGLFFVAMKSPFDDGKLFIALEPHWSAGDESVTTASD